MDHDHTTSLHSPPHPHIPTSSDLVRKFTQCLKISELVTQPYQTLKVVFKFHLEKKILGEKWGGTPILRHFSPILAILKIFTSVLTFQGGKKIFFCKSAPKVV